MKLCIACKTHHPESEFAPAGADFPTRDGLNYNCRASTKGKPTWMRQHNKRIRMRTFNTGDHVRKTKGSEWQGYVVGTYSTELTPEGYAVESDTHKGSVQIYPAHALELVAVQPETPQ